MKWKSLSHVGLFATPWTPGHNGVGSLSLLQPIFPTQGSGISCIADGFFKLSYQGSPQNGEHVILQARTLEWVAFPFSRGSSQLRDRTRSPILQADSLPAEPQGKPMWTWTESILRCCLFPRGVPQDSVVKNLPAKAADPGSIPGSRRSPGGGSGNPLQYSCLGNPMDRGAWRATVHGVTNSQTRLSD